MESLSASVWLWPPPLETIKRAYLVRIQPIDELLSNLRPCCKYHLIKGVYKRIFFAFITPSNFFVPFTVFLSVFSLYIFISLGISPSPINKQWRHLPKFVINLVGYFNINLHKPTKFSFKYLP